MIEVNSTLIAGAGIALGMIAGFWRQAHSFMRYAAGVFVLQKTLDPSIAAEVAVYIRKHYKKVPSGLSVISSVYQQIDNNVLVTVVPFEMPSPVSTWRGPHGTFVLSASNGGMTKLFSLRFVSKPNDLIVEAIHYDLARRNDTFGGNFFVRRIMGTAGDAMQTMAKPSRDEESPTASVGEASAQRPVLGVDESFMYEQARYMRTHKKRDPLQGMFYQKEVYTLIDELKYWFAQREWYADRGIPWRTGVLAYGPGGTGKSSLARVVAETLKIPIYQYYLNTLRDTEFVQEWEQMQTPCVVALDDFDTVFHGRESVTNHKSLSFECVLNQISGISSLNGVLLMVSTNVLEHIDPALGRIDANGRPTRPGRIDRIIRMAESDEDQRRNLATFTLNGWADDLIEKLVAEGEGTTAAQFQNMCIIEAQQLILSQKTLQ